MTAIDLLIIGVTLYAIWRCRLIVPAGRRPTARRGLRLTVLGLLVVCLFYLADLATMYVLPALTSMQEATQWMGTLHRNFSWLVVLIAMIAISGGFIDLVIELQRREKRVRRLVDSNVVGVLIWDADRRVVDANDAFLAIVGYERGDLGASRLRWPELTPPEWREAYDRSLAELNATGTARPYEMELIRRGGDRVAVLVGAASFNDGSNGGVAFVVDLTDRKNAEAAARDSERRYREIEMELAHANRVATMGQLSASIGHEVNQPIAAAVANAQAGLAWLSAKPPNLEEIRQVLDRIVKNGHQASNVVARLNSFIKKAPPRKEGLEINEAILEVIALSRGEVTRHGVSVQMQLADGLPRIRGDRVQLQQVILNLIINAIEAMTDLGEGSRLLRVTSAKDASGGVVVTVQDSGPGLGTANVERIFEPFYTTKSAGLGMGLSICRSIVEEHGGRLWATAGAAAVSGASFNFTVPRASGPGPARLSGPPRAPHGHRLFLPNPGPAAARRAGPFHVKRPRSRQIFANIICLKL
ncbi:MAG: sensor histidine kinase [Candidatus Eiseniibacteriota bacterium]